jgi:predicted RNase H-like HicB family nuclease
MTERNGLSEVVIRLEVEPLDEGGYVATSPDVPGLVAEGRTLVEVAEIAQNLARQIVEVCIEYGDPLPPVFAQKSNTPPATLTIPVGIG